MEPEIRLRGTGRAWHWEVVDAKTGTVLVRGATVYADKDIAWADAQDALQILTARAAPRG